MSRSVSRILMTTDSSGPVWQYAVALCRSLGEAGVEVVLLTLGKRLTQEQHRNVWAVPNLSIYEEPLRAEWMDESWRDLHRTGEILLELERRFAPDVVHLNGYAHAALPFRAPVVVVAHGCGVAWWRAVYGSRTGAHLESYRERVLEGLRSADAVVTATYAQQEDLLTHYGPLSGTRVIPHGCDPEAYLPDWKEELVFAAGRLWDPARNLAALARVSSSLPWPVYAADDEQHPPLALSTIELQRPFAMQMLGKQSGAELGNWLGRASIFVQPARYESHGVSALQAACSGCALVLGDIPSLRELWEDVAVFVDPEDDERLRTALQTLITERTSREALGHAARERALLFTQREMAREYLRLYEHTRTKANARRRASREGAREQVRVH